MSVKLRGEFLPKFLGTIIFPMPNPPNKYFPPTLALLTGAVVWGLIWYPYRLVATQGVAGEAATFITYLIALAFTSVFLFRSWRDLSTAPWRLAAIGLAAGWTNFGYVLGILNGEVMRVLLLFYLAPVWTVPLARLLLKEKPSAASYGAVAVALVGAIVMLWRPELGWPVPRTAADWFGLTSGMAFALNNVLSRRLGDCGIGAKSLASCLGVLAMTGVWLLLFPKPMPVWSNGSANLLLLLITIGAGLFVINIVVQYGLTHTPAVRAIIIMLFELVVAAISSHLLAGETMSAQQWVGGALIITATLSSGVARI